MVPPRLRCGRRARQRRRRREHAPASSRRRTSGVDLAAVTWASALSVALNREMDLAFSWSWSDPTALDPIRGAGRRRTNTLAYVYAFGR
jgi:hypothetical protein